MPDLHQTLQQSESEDLGALVELALDLRNCWNHSTDPLWSKIEPELWALTHNPWVVLQTCSRTRLESLRTNPEFRDQVKERLEKQRRTLKSPAWFQHAHSNPQFYDRTRQRISTFFGEGIVAHVAFGDPICPELAAVVAKAGQAAGVVTRSGGTYVCMEGPQFSTRAESNAYRAQGFDIVGMTNLQEAKLAREAEICYVTIAMVTDYDCWHPDHDSVTVEQVVAVLNRNAGNAANVVREAVAALPASRGCKCGQALATSIITAPEAIPPATRARLELLVGKYLPTKAGA